MGEYRVMPWTPSAVAASSGALIRDDADRLLVLKPTYKSGWTLPGGVMEADGESPWQACRREVLEETGLTVTHGRLVAVDTRPAKPDQLLGLRFLFDCGSLDDAAARGVRLQEEELSEHRFVVEEEALELLRKPVRRRVAAVLAARGSGCLYLEDGRVVDGVG